MSSEIIMLDSDTEILLPEPIDAEKELKVGYDLDRFAEPPREEFKCPVCFGVVRLPKECQTCGMLICSKCEQGCRKALFAFDMGVSVPHEQSCPICRASSPFRNPSKVLVEVILKLKIRCTNYRSGCPFEAPIKDIKKHERQCQFKTIKCANSILCQKRGRPSDLQIVEIPAKFAQSNRCRKFKEKGMFACSDVCKKLALMELHLDMNDKEEVLKMFEVAVDEYESLSK